MAVLASCQKGQREVDDEDHRRHEDAELDPEGLSKEFASAVNADEVGPDRAQRADHEDRKLDIGELDREDLALALLGDEVVGGAEEAQEQPDDQRVGVDHAHDVEGQDLGQRVRRNVDPAQQQPAQHLGSGHVPPHSQQMTVAASAIAEKKVFGHRSYRVATRRQSLSLPNMISHRCPAGHHGT